MHRMQLQGCQWEVIENAELHFVVNLAPVRVCASDQWDGGMGSPFGLWRASSQIPREQSN